MRQPCLPFVFALALLAGLASAAAQQVDNGIRAIVNAKVITQYQVAMNAKPAVDLLRRKYAGTPELRQRIEDAYTNSLRQLIDREMIVNDFQASGFKLPDPIVDEYVRSRWKEQFGDRTEFIKTLQAQGMSFEKYKEDARERIIVGALEEKNVGKATIVSPLKLERYYQQRKEEFKLPDQIKLRVIVLDSSSAPTTEDRVKLAEEIRSQILGGTTFAEMAAVYSTGSQRSQGGDWGLVKQSTLREDFAGFVFDLPTNQVSSVFKAQNGECYLFLVEEKLPAHYQPLADTEVRDKLEKELLLEERKRLQDGYIKKLQEKTFVVRY